MDALLRLILGTLQCAGGCPTELAVSIRALDDLGPAFRSIGILRAAHEVSQTKVADRYEAAGLYFNQIRSWRSQEPLAG